MSTIRLHSIFCIIATLCLIAFPVQSQAAPKGKAKPPQQIQKERLVLMPLRLGEADQQLQGAMEMALVKGLQQRYEVFFGEQVAKKAREIFLKESRNTAKKECDETRCLQGIAEAFQAELLATANITKQSDGYFIALSVQNLFDNKVVQSESLPCKGCDAYAVIDKLKELVGAALPVASIPAAEAPPPKVNQNDPDAVLWAEVQKGNSADDYQVYIDTYPKGKYLPLAKARIKKLKEEAKALAEQQEQSAWDIAQQGSSENSYAQYLKGYPTGRFTGLAKVRLDKLKNDVAAREESELWKNINEGEQGRAGIQIQQVTQEIASSYGLSKPEGALVVNVEKGGPADLVGIRAGDVILKYDGKLVNNSVDLPPMIAATKPSSSVLFDVWRHVENFQVSVVIGKQEKNISDVKESVESYLKKYPSGRYLAAARAKLQAIKEEESRYTPPVMVSISGKNYEIGKYEVTQKEWRDVMGNNPSQFSNCGENCPVEQVSWDDIQVFLQKLNAKTGRQYRLPTEGEWEYACFGGSQTKYCGSNDIDSVAWYGGSYMPSPTGNSGDKTHPVGQKQANGYGLYDMSGNVWEWMQNLFDESKPERAFRGGSWFHLSQHARAANHFASAVATHRDGMTGFRLARTLP